MFSNAVKLCSFRGFDIRLDPSWVVIAALITWSLSQHYFPSVFPDQPGQTYLIMGLIAMLCFFASLLPETPQKTVSVPLGTSSTVRREA